MSRERWLVLVGVAAAACDPTSTRPAITPYPEALSGEIRLAVPEATRRLAESLKADSIPVTRVRVRDGYIETPWFEAEQASERGRSPHGTGTGEDSSLGRSCEAGKYPAQRRDPLPSLGGSFFA